MKRLTSLVIMMAMIVGLLPAAQAAEPELLSLRGDGIYIYRYPGGMGIGLIREDGTFLTEPVYDEIKDFSEGYVQASQGEKWGLLDETGKVCVPLEYDYVGPASQGICYAVRNEKYGYLNAGDGSAITGLIYDRALDFWNIGRVERYEPDGEGNVYSFQGAVNREGKLVVPMEYDYIYLSPNGDAYITQNYSRPISEWNYYGAYDLEGNLLYPCEYTSEKRLLAAIASGGDEFIQVEGSSQAAGLSVDWYPQAEFITRIYGSDRMALAKNGCYALYGLDGTQYTDFIFEAIGEQRAPGEILAAKGGRWGVIDPCGNTVADFFWETQEEARDGVEARFVSQWADGSAPYALADWGGKLLTDYKYWDYGEFHQGLASVSDGTAYGFVDASGREVVPCKYHIVKPFEEDGFAIVYNYDGRIYNAVDTTGRELWVEGDPYAKIWRAGHGIWGRGHEWGAVTFWNSQGELVTPTRYYYRTNPKGIMEGNIFDKNGVAPVYLEDGTSVCIDTQGNRVEGYTDWDFNEDTGSDWHEGLIWTRQDGWELSGQWELEKGWGFKDEAGELVVPYLYDAVGYFDHGYASVRLDGIYGMLKNPLLEDEEAHKVSDWAVAEVSAAAEAGYVTPRCSTYQTHTITRLQFAELAVNYLEKKTGETIAPAPADTFTDTQDETILKAYAAGIVQGVGEGRFDPGGLLTREQLATMLWRAMEKVGVGMHYGSLNQYTDADQISDWASFAMNNLVCHQVLTGTSETTLSPKASCTVEQAILLVYRAKELPGRREQEAQRQAAIDRVTIVGLPIGMPVDQLPQELRAALQFQGETDDFAPIPDKEICKRYTAPGIEIVTSTVLDQVAEQWFHDRENTAGEEFLELFGTTDRQTALAQVLGREYVECVILTGDAYPMASGLKVGDSEERVKELGYYLNGENKYSEVAYSLGSAYIDLESGKVIRIKVYDSIGRRAGPFFDP